MDKKTFIECMDHLCDYFDPFNIMNEKRAARYWDDLKHIPDDEFTRVKNILVREFSESRFPLPVHFLDAWRSFHPANLKKQNALDEAERAAPAETKQFLRGIKDTLKSAGALPAIEEQKPETNADDILASTYLTGGQS